MQTPSPDTRRTIAENVAQCGDPRLVSLRVRPVLPQGHRLYTVSPPTGDQADVELYEDTIPTNPDQSTDDNLDELPRCE